MYVSIEIWYITTWFLVFSDLRNSKTLLAGTGSQREVAALSTIPEGLPGSSTLFLVMTLTFSRSSGSGVQAFAVEAPTPVEKLNTILSASFIILFRPSWLVITAYRIRIHNLLINTIFLKMKEKKKNWSKMMRCHIYIPQSAPWGMLVAIALARRSHVLSIAATQRLAPNARVESTKFL